MSIRQLIQLFQSRLSPIYPEDEINNITFLVLSSVMHPFSRIDMVLRKNENLNDEVAEKISHILDELCKHRPLQYVLGSAEFYGLTFHVNENVLIPRPETEELVDWIIKDVKETSGNHPMQIFDAGTGSGCIAITLKKYIPQSGVTAIDVSPGALAVAKENADINNVTVNFRLADILNLSSHDALGRFDIIVSNPPYVTEKEKTGMRPNVIDFEPHLALFVENDDPLKFYSAITAFALSHLKSPGALYFEINEAFASPVMELLGSSGFGPIELKKDLSGRDRMIKASFP